MKSLKEGKKDKELSLGVKGILLGVSLLAGIITFLCIYLPNKDVKGFRIGLTVFFMVFGIGYSCFSLYVKDKWNFIGGIVGVLAGIIMLMAVVLVLKWYVCFVSALAVLGLGVIILFAFGLYGNK